MAIVGLSMCIAILAGIFLGLSGCAGTEPAHCRSSARVPRRSAGRFPGPPARAGAGSDFYLNQFMMVQSGVDLRHDVFG